MAQVAERLSKLEKYVKRQRSWKERYDKLETDFKSLKRDHEKAKKKLKELTDKSAERVEKRVADLRAESERLREDLKSADVLKAKKDEEIAKLRKELEGFQELKGALAKIIPVPRARIPAGPPSPSEISVTTEQPALTVEVHRKPLTLDQSNLEGKIAIVYAEGSLPTDKWFTTTHVYRAMRGHGWPRDPRTSKMLDKFCQWGFFEKRYAGKRPEYRVRMKPEKAKEKGLLKVTEKIA